MLILPTSNEGCYKTQCLNQQGTKTRAPALCSVLLKVR